MNQDQQVNQTQLESILRYTTNMNQDKVPKGVLSQIEYIYNSINTITNSNYSVSDDQIKQLQSSLKIISTNLLDIFLKDPSSLLSDHNNGIHDIQGMNVMEEAQSKMDEISEYQISDPNLKDQQRQPTVFKHGYILAEQDTDASNYFINRQINIQLDDQVGNKIKTEYRNQYKGFNACLDNLIRGIKGKEDIKGIIQQRLRIEQDQTKYNQERMLSMQMQQNPYIPMIQDLPPDNTSLVPNHQNSMENEDDRQAYQMRDYQQGDEEPMKNSDKESDDGYSDEHI